jgi:hypothetical protein
MIRMLRAGIEMRRIERNDWDDPRLTQDERAAILRFAGGRG